MKEIKDRELFAWHVAKSMTSIMLQALEKGENGMSKKVADPMKQTREKFCRMMEENVPDLSPEEEEMITKELRKKYANKPTTGYIDDAL